jgi:ATP-dependent Lon protease
VQGEEKHAMTGEITTGKVLPVGGIKEKILWLKESKRFYYEQNRRDIEEIKADYLKGLTFHYKLAI